MIKSILGRKIGMTQVFAEGGVVVPVTVVEAGPVVVTQVRSNEKEGYNAVQVGFGEVSPNRVNKPRAGHFAKTGVAPKRYLREFRVDEIGDLQVGQEIKVDIFEPGDRVSVTGVSKGKGFAGAMKRWHFHGGPKSHGSMVHRKPQSGGATDAARTFKGSKRPGRMGGETVTTRGLRIVSVDPEKNLLLVKGAVPGASGGVVIVSKME
ncbi:MAG TPA: 50S ribosomal protein L3 [Armatimonadota bacterium]|nr:50S ribosomal protein L3 [Armatimonadota bacterium]